MVARRARWEQHGERHPYDGVEDEQDARDRLVAVKRQRDRHDPGAHHHGPGRGWNRVEGALDHAGGWAAGHQRAAE
jgi:hypothetical protein